MAFLRADGKANGSGGCRCGGRRGGLAAAQRLRPARGAAGTRRRGAGARGAGVSGPGGPSWSPARRAQRLGVMLAGRLCAGCGRRGVRGREAEGGADAGGSGALEAGGMAPAERLGGGVAR